MAERFESANEITAEQRLILRAAFCELGAEHGQLVRERLCERLDEEEIDTLWHVLDPAGEGTVGFHDFLERIGGSLVTDDVKLKGVNDEQLLIARMAFHALRPDACGVVRRTAAVDALQALQDADAEYLRSYPAADVELMWQTIDRPCSGSVAFPEFTVRLSLLSGCTVGTPYDYLDTSLSCDLSIGSLAVDDSASRQRSQSRAEYVERLEAEVRELTKRNQELQRENDRLKVRNRELERVTARPAALIAETGSTMLKAGLRKASGALKELKKSEETDRQQPQSRAEHIVPEALLELQQTVTSLVDKISAGDQKHDIEAFVRGPLCTALSRFFVLGFKSNSLFKKHHIFEVVEEAVAKADERMACLRKHVETLNRSMYECLRHNNNVRFRSLVSAALNAHQAAALLGAAANPQLTAKWYEKGAPIRSEDVIAALKEVLAPMDELYFELDPTAEAALAEPKQYTY